MSGTSEHTEALGEAGETCRDCGAPLAVDQRYCLNCGRRRGAPRVDFREHLPAASAANGNGAVSTPPPTMSAPPVATTPAEQKPGRDYAPLAAVGGIAILGLMLLVGVLIGKGDGGTATPPPQVVRLGDEGAGTTASEDGSDGGAGDAKKAKAKASGKAAKDAGSLTGAKSGGAPVEASDEALQQLQEQSPEEYQESSAKLPDEIATGGAPPPEDNKTPGGGSKGTAIE